MLTDVLSLFGAFLSKTDDNPVPDMSSIASRKDAQLASLNKKPAAAAAAAAAMDDKHRQKLVRTSSIERIRRFNTYLCTQHYYVVPAILAWLRSSQDVLHQSVEKPILHFRSVIINAVCHRLVGLDFKSISYRTAVQQVRLASERVREMTGAVRTSYEVDARCLKGLIYLAAAVLACQLSFCVFVVCSTSVPVGMVFLMVCTVYIALLYSRATFHFLATKAGCTRRSRSKLKAH